MKTEDKKQTRVSKLTKNELLLINIGSTSTGGRVLSVKADLAKIQLTSPACTEIGEKVALSRRIEKHWRLVGENLSRPVRPSEHHLLLCLQVGEAFNEELCWRLTRLGLDSISDVQSFVFLYFVFTCNTTLHPSCGNNCPIVRTHVTSGTRCTCAQVWSLSESTHRLKLTLFTFPLSHSHSNLVAGTR